MKIRLKSCQKLLIISLIMILSRPISVFAAEPTNPSGLPDIVASQSVDSSNNTVGTEVTSPSGQKFYGGLGGSEAVLNYEPGYLHGFVQYNIGNCKDKIGLPAMLCFVLEYPGVQPTSVKTLWSRTYRDGVADLETSTLLYPDNLIVGDVYGFDNSNFEYSYFGKNLLLTPGSATANAFWKLSGYGFNPKAQAFWNAGNNAAMNQTITRLKSNAKNLSALSAGNFNGICGFGFAADCPSAYHVNQYPEGRVWVVPAGTTITISGDLTYFSKGTIIIPNGNLIIDGNIKYLPSVSNSSLGFIVEHGDITFKNGSGKQKNIKASFFAPNGLIKILGNNIQFIGSFVAQNFSTPGVSNISFIYDQRTESNWPPGFRDLQIPSLLAK